MNPTNPAPEMPQSNSVAPKSSSLKKWVIAINIVFAAVTLSMYILLMLLSNDRLNDSNMTEWLVTLVLGLGMIITYILTAVSAIAAITLNAIYLPTVFRSSMPKVVIRILLVIVNIAVFFIYSIVLSSLLLF